MTILDSALQLDIEKALEALLTQKEIVPASWQIFCAHRADKQEAETTSFVSIIAGLPDWTQFDGEGAVTPVTFQLGTDVAEPKQRAAQALLHQKLAGNIIDLFARANFDDVLALLNSPLVQGLGFDGWEGPLTDSEDGRSTDEKKFAPKLNFIFESFIYAF